MKKLIYFAILIFAVACGSKTQHISPRADDSLAQYRDHYGDILLAVGNKQEALKQWKKALELDAGNKELLEKVEKLALELQPADTKENTDDK